MEVGPVLFREVHCMQATASRKECGKYASVVDTLAVTRTVFFLLSGLEERLMYLSR